MDQLSRYSYLLFKCKITHSHLALPKLAPSWAWAGSTPMGIPIPDNQSLDLRSISSSQSNNSGGDDLYTVARDSPPQSGSYTHTLGHANSPPSGRLGVSGEEIFSHCFDGSINGLGREPPIPFNPSTTHTILATADIQMPSLGNSLGTQNTESASTLAGYEPFLYGAMQQSHFMSSACPPGVSARPHSLVSNMFANAPGHCLHDLSPQLNAIPTAVLRSPLNPSHDVSSQLSACFSHDEKIPLTYSPFQVVAEDSTSNALLHAFHNDRNEFPTVSYNAPAQPQLFPTAGCTVLPSSLGENLPPSSVYGSGSSMEYNSGLDLRYPSGYLNTQNCINCSGPILHRPTSDLATDLTYITDQQVGYRSIFKVLSC
jgi:hypothetical protein